MAKRKTAEEKAAAKAAPVETPVETQPEEVPMELVTEFEVDLFDATDVCHNGRHYRLPKGKQVVSERIYNVLKDANLV